MAKHADAVPVSSGERPKNSDAQSISIAEFDGSFAPNARPVETRALPWYRSREYFLDGWLDPQTWKAAVCSSFFRSAIAKLSSLLTSTPVYRDGGHIMPCLRIRAHRGNFAELWDASIGRVHRALQRLPDLGVHLCDRRYNWRAPEPHDHIFVNICWALPLLERLVERN